ncbi:hypothetical protein COF76_22545 [Bacillus wiedmannii]|uniref:hypothetical protein n=2 Tax=Bacillus TaxID=1386 RepID=UPI000BFDFDE8|nr:hypothetical protein [Bacillus wiedmannii]PHE95055.1 hypothetical protein COF76_22545 [Bacillus wiedmannii]
MRKEITSTYGFIEIPASATRYLDLPESVKAELYAKKRRRRRRRKPTRSTAETSQDGVNIFEGNNEVKTKRRQTEAPKQAGRERSTRRNKMPKLVITFNGGKPLEDDEQAIIKRLN